MNFVARKSTYTLIKGLGFILLILYFYIYRDFSFSLVWALSYVVISCLIAVISVELDLDRRFPALGKCLFVETYEESDDKEWAKAEGNYLLNMFSGWSFFLTPGEDGFICVPILLFGINPITALIGGLVFGLLHIVRFSYFECLMKVIIYALVCNFVLPHGLLTVIAGHMITNAIAWISGTLVLNKLEK